MIGPSSPNSRGVALRTFFTIVIELHLLTVALQTRMSIQRIRSLVGSLIQL
jgi:hypothetical protein